MSLTRVPKTANWKAKPYGLFAYLASRDANKSRVKTEKARQEPRTSPNKPTAKRCRIPGKHHGRMARDLDAADPGPPVIVLPADTAEQSAIADENSISTRGQSELATKTDRPRAIEKGGLAKDKDQKRESAEPGP